MAGSGRHQLSGRAHPPAPHRAALAPAIVAAAYVAAALAVVALAVAAVTMFRPEAFDAVRGAPTAADAIDVGGAQLPIHRVPAAGADAHSIAEERLIAATIADLTTFWSEQLPPLTGRVFAPLKGGITAMDSSASTGTAPCVASPGRIVGNAFFCPTDDGIVYDAGTLVPVLLHRYGVAGLVTTFAHEFGHAAQAQIGQSAGDAANDRSVGAASPAPAQTDQLVTEARADCDAGAFLAWVVAGRAQHVHLGTDALVAAVGPLLDFADPATVSATDPSAHGLALDRLSWVLRGYRGGVSGCAAVTSGTLQATLGTVTAGSGADASPVPAQRFTTRRALLSAAERSIYAFAMPDAAATRDGSLDADTRQATASGLLDAAAAHGQYAQATVLAVVVGRHTSGSLVGAACFAGAWTATVYGHAAPGALGSWPGDADEGLAAVRLQPHVSFDDLAAYADGFHRGRSACVGRAPR